MHLVTQMDYVLIKLQKKAGKLGYITSIPCFHLQELSVNFGTFCFFAGSLVSFFSKFHVTPCGLGLDFWLLTSLPVLLCPFESRPFWRCFSLTLAALTGELAPYRFSLGTSGDLLALRLLWIFLASMIIQKWSQRQNWRQLGNTNKICTQRNDLGGGGGGSSIRNTNAEKNY